MDELRPGVRFATLRPALPGSGEKAGHTCSELKGSVQKLQKLIRLPATNFTELQLGETKGTMRSNLLVRHQALILRAGSPINSQRALQSKAFYTSAALPARYADGPRRFLLIPGGSVGHRRATNQRCSRGPAQGDPPAADSSPLDSRRLRAYRSSAACSRPHRRPRHHRFASCPFLKFV